MKIISIVGARPQFIKAAVIHRALKKYKEVNSLIIHTGQHYDEKMSCIFFEELNIPKPDYNLEVGSGSHGLQTGLILQRLEKVLIKEKPDWCIVYGDTNSTIAGALAATKIHIPTAHVEAGLRSYNKRMPEEINRISTDHISSLLFAPTKTAVNILQQEGLSSRTVFSGDVMYDSILFYTLILKNNENAYEKIDQPFYLATIHRQENTDNKKKLSDIFKALSKLQKRIILPLHPRTKKYLKSYNIDVAANIQIINPTSYLHTIHLLSHCEKVLTDSGGLQKEAYFLKKPCISLREETEWVETLNGNWNQLAGSNINKIIQYTGDYKLSEQEKAFGNGKAGKIIVKTMLKSKNVLL
ncbi:MAG: UDP-N-acetylglucosamine 2-epimerase (non-hydrolyzing) [Calditrichia bacterium]|jgi:UDP-N-acetylglucosamine 2-epimerase|nr:UDP-N-acetylglucosamine 2-epimerase (non-hydrolyzing) [Calditrichia bacterium]